MTKYGNQFSGTDENKKASGIFHNSSARHYDNMFALATDGGSAEALKIADIGPGTVLEELVIDTDANLSGVTFKIGTAADDDKYGTAVAGPNATVQRRQVLLAVQQVATTTREEILLTPSGAIPGAGTITTRLIGSHR